MDDRRVQIEEDEAISRMKADALDRLVAAGKISEIHRERVRFIVRRIVQPPEPAEVMPKHPTPSARLCDNDAFKPCGRDDRESSEHC